jgi:hypothetical protein
VLENENNLFLKITGAFFYPKGLEDFSSHSSSISCPTGCATTVKLTVIIRKTAPPHMLTLGNRVKCHRTATIKLGRCSPVVFAQIPPSHLEAFALRVVVDNKVAHFLAAFVDRVYELPQPLAK